MQLFWDDRPGRSKQKPPSSEAPLEGSPIGTRERCAGALVTGPLIRPFKGAWSGPLRKPSKDGSFVILASGFRFTLSELPVRLCAGEGREGGWPRGEAAAGWQGLGAEAGLNLRGLLGRPHAEGLRRPRNLYFPGSGSAATIRKRSRISLFVSDLTRGDGSPWGIPEDCPAQALPVLPPPPSTPQQLLWDDCAAPPQG